MKVVNSGWKTQRKSSRLWDVCAQMMIRVTIYPENNLTEEAGLTKDDFSFNLVLVNLVAASELSMTQICEIYK